MPPTATATLSVHIYCCQVHAVNATNLDANQSTATLGRQLQLNSSRLASTPMPPTATATLSVHIYCRQVHAVNVH
ncbi:hypothetical protein Taro_019720 [Colocasia esculenta]|uniref:Uncharacterized protein n=1 Tax=Colocasia esculenta TaxID=4460 RepID=A0A843V324_COLES|nr:hypothetical protein [Colocasia esculenta]